MTYITDKNIVLGGRSRAWVAAIIVAVLQTAVLGYMVGERAWGLRSGTEVLLKTAPVDPRDLLRGDYVILNYDISRVPISTMVEGPPKMSRNDAILSVRLKKQDDGYWGIVESSFGALAPKPDTVVLKSLPVDYVFYGDAIDPSQAIIGVTYGIERYYVPEGQGHDIESARNDNRVAVAARVSSDGVAHIRSLLLDGKSVYEEPLY
ncbi:GDYXXLXY domain-containing protein [Rhizobium sp. P40RR-XXII]|uniref:GDYXXLXY domain-containing protein n=1 Tax=unclassified Rhizobium TaxID=2613769 RepID=UPI001456797C|nr:MULTISPECIES: GDYXXLXY domain-containing protein [unclassified Rhizobium]NLR83690.1 GDYXXLXY domain-containing protein [Rhizobium sp. P28RR-XV]NLS16110.1 GDYXXLXY domain-containing protein [Rhizobium sp. P40RR-XXII]